MINKLSFSFRIFLIHFLSQPLLHIVFHTLPFPMAWEVYLCNAALFSSCFLSSKITFYSTGQYIYLHISLSTQNITLFHQYSGLWNHHSTTFIGQCLYRYSFIFSPKLILFSHNLILFPVFIKSLFKISPCISLKCCWKILCTSSNYWKISITFSFCFFLSLSSLKTATIC